MPRCGELKKELSKINLVGHKTLPYILCSNQYSRINFWNGISNGLDGNSDSGDDVYYLRILEEKAQISVSFSNYKRRTSDCLFNYVRCYIDLFYLQL